MRQERAEMQKMRKTGLSSDLRSARQQDMVRVAPGVAGWIPAEGQRGRISKYVMCRWSEQSDGTYLPVPLRWRMMQVGPRMIEALGFTRGRQVIKNDTFRRLADAGFINLVQVSPKVWMLDLDSWFAHVEECLNDPEYWAEGSEARERYNFYNGLGRHRKK